MSALRAALPPYVMFNGLIEFPLNRTNNGYTGFDSKFFWERRIQVFVSMFAAEDI
jgi:hypothetical protein